MNTSELAESPKHTRITGGKNWLSEIINNEIKQHTPPVPFIERLGINKPSWKTVISSFGFLLITIILFSLIPSLFMHTKWLIDDTQLIDSYLAMWQVQGAIAAVALPLLIVVIEFSKELRDVAGKRPEALIRESWIFPIIIFALVGTIRIGIDIGFFLNELVFWIDLFLVFIGTICFTIIAYKRMLSVLLDSQEMKQSSVALMKDLMAIQLDNTIKRRIANNLLIKIVKEIGFEFTSFVPSLDRYSNATILKYHNSGYLCDINLKQLETFQKELLGKATLQRRSEVRNNSQLEDVKSSEKVDLRIWWMKQFDQHIKSADSGIIKIDNIQYSTSIVRELEAQLAKIIKVSTDKYKGEEVRDIISYVGDGLIDSIRNYKSGAVKEGLEIYEALLITFLSKLKQWNAVYKKDTAIREVNSIGGGWDEIEWINNDLQQVNYMAMDTEYIPILQIMLNMPRRISLLSIKDGDYYIFNEFINWYPYYYHKTFNMKDSSAREFIVGRCSLHLSETLKYYIIPNIERGNNEVEIQSNTDFALGIIFVFNQLLKDALDNNEIDHFSGFLTTLNEAFEFYFRHNQEHEVRSLEYQLKNTSLPSTRKDGIEQQLHLKKVCVSAAATLKKIMDVMRYGLNSWLLHMYLNGRLTSHDMEKWNSVFDNPGNLEKCWEMYSLARNTDESGLKWALWESMEHERGAAYFGTTIYWGGGFENYLRALLCANCLKILGALTDDQKRAVTIPSSSDVILLAENENSPLRQLLKQITQNKNKWLPIITDSGFKAIPLFEDLLDKAIDAQKEAKNNFIRAAAISPTRLDLFKKEILDEWKKNAELRNIVREYGEYEVFDKPSEDNIFIGFNQLQPKDIYVDNTEIGIERWGAQFGEDLAGWENEDFIEKILTSIDELDEDIGAKSPTVIVTQALDRLEQINCIPIILILNSWTTSSEIEKSELFKNEDNKPVKGFVGYFRNAPALNLSYRGEPYIIVIDLKKFCVWRQFKPPLSDNDEYLNDELTFSLKPFTMQSAEEAIINNQRLLFDEDDKPKSKDDVISELQLKVHFKLFEQYEIKIKDKSSGYKIKTRW